MMDLASIHGRIALGERAVRPEEVGKALKDIGTGMGVRIYRAGKPYSFADDEAKELKTGDVIVEIVPQGAAKLARAAIDEGRRARP